MTAHNPAMSFWPLERQLDGGPPVSDADCREMLIEARRLARTVIEQQVEIDRLRETLRKIADTEPPSELWAGDLGVRAIRAAARAALTPSRAATNALGNIAHAMREDGE